MTDFIKTIVITGPTATGKTALAVRLARLYHGEIVSVDSRQVYRGMDLGTGKDLDEYGEIPYHLIDVADPAVEEYNLARFCRDAHTAVAEIAARGRTPFLCGGTALYLAALLEGYRLPGGKLPRRDSGMPRVRQQAEAEPSYEPPFRIEPLILGVYYPRAEVRARIERRLDDRLTSGLVDEVRQLHEERGVSYDKLESFGLEYREIARYLRGGVFAPGHARHFARPDPTVRQAAGYLLPQTGAAGAPDPLAQSGTGPRPRRPHRSVSRRPAAAGAGVPALRHLLRPARSQRPGAGALTRRRRTHFPIGSAQGVSHRSSRSRSARTAPPDAEAESRLK